MVIFCLTTPTGCPVEAYQGLLECKIFVLNFNIVSGFFAKFLGVGCIFFGIFKVCNCLIF
jgi:hypothetical protein